MPNHEGPQGPAVRPNREPGAQAAPAQGGPRAGHGPRGPDDDPELHRQRIAQAAGGVLRDAAGRLLAGSHLNSPGRTGAESWKTAFKRCSCWVLAYLQITRGELSHAG